MIMVLRKSSFSLKKKPPVAITGGFFNSYPITTMRLYGDGVDHIYDLRLQLFRIGQGWIPAQFIFIERNLAIKCHFEDTTLARRECDCDVRPTGRKKFASHPESHGVVTSGYAVFYFGSELRTYFSHVDLQHFLINS